MVYMILVLFIILLLIECFKLYDCTVKSVGEISSLILEIQDNEKQIATLRKEINSLKKINDEVEI